MTEVTADLVLSAYREVLKNPALSAQDDFFDSGGDSIAAMEVAEKTMATTGVELPIAWFFIYPTAEELAEAIAMLAAEGT